MSDKQPFSPKIIIRLLAALFFVVLIGRIVHRFIWDHEQTVAQEVGYLDDLRAQEAVKETETFFSQGEEGISYNFRKMIQLIDACGKVKRETAYHFEGDLLVAKKPVDRNDVTNLLKELLKERKRLRNYIWDLKGYAHTGISVKRYRSLLYYMEVLENNIVQMRDLLARKK